MTSGLLKQLNYSIDEKLSRYCQNCHLWVPADIDHVCCEEGYPEHRIPYMGRHNRPNFRHTDNCSLCGRTECRKITEQWVYLYGLILEKSICDDFVDGTDE